MSSLQRRFWSWIGSLAAIVMALGWLGPSIDHGPSYASYGYTPDDEPEAQVANSRAADQALCNAQHGPHSVALQMPDGQHRCTDKHGRKLARLKTTIAQEAAP